MLTIRSEVLYKMWSFLGSIFLNIFFELCQSIKHFENHKCAKIKLRSWKKINHVLRNYWQKRVYSVPPNTKTYINIVACSSFFLRQNFFPPLSGKNTVSLGIPEFLSSPPSAVCFLLHSPILVFYGKPFTSVVIVGEIAR